MTSRVAPALSPPDPPARRRRAGADGGARRLRRQEKDKPVLQTAAKVNKEEITVSQINQVLGQQRALPAEQAASAAGVALERLIDQELALQKASDQKLDREPRVMQQIEAARREIISRAYVEKIGEGAPKPTPGRDQGLLREASGAVRQPPDLQPAGGRHRGRPGAARCGEGGAGRQPRPSRSSSTTSRRTASSSRARRAFVPPSSCRSPASSSSRRSRTARRSSSPGRTAPASSTWWARAASRSTCRRRPPRSSSTCSTSASASSIADDLRALRGAAKIEYVGDYAANKPPPLPMPPPDAPPVTSIAPPAGSRRRCGAPDRRGSARGRAGVDAERATYSTRVSRG